MVKKIQKPESIRGALIKWGNLCDWLAERIWLSPVGLKLKVEATIRKVVSY